MNFTSLVWYFFSMFFRRFSFRFSPFFVFLLFRRHAFYTVNTMVFSLSALAQNRKSIRRKAAKNTFSEEFQRPFPNRFASVFGDWNTVYQRSAFLSRPAPEMAPKRTQNFLPHGGGSQSLRRSRASGASLSILASLLAPFWLPFGSLGLPFGSLGLPFGSLGLPFGTLALTFGTLGLTFGSLLASFGSLLLSPGHFFHIFMHFR